MDHLKHHHSLKHQLKHKHVHSLKHQLKHKHVHSLQHQPKHKHLHSHKHQLKHKHLHSQYHMHLHSHKHQHPHNPFTIQHSHITQHSHVHKIMRPTATHAAATLTRRRTHHTAVSRWRQIMHVSLWTVQLDQMLSFKHLPSATSISVKLLFRDQR
jgi:hypothetical protein